MKRTTLFFLAMLSLLLVSSCNSDLRQTKNLYDDWWPIQASGTLDNGAFSARWDGDLGVHGDIVITFVNKTNSTLSYEDTRYYPMLSFSKSKKAFCTVSIRSLGDMKASRFRKFYVKDGKIFFEKGNEYGSGTGEYEEGESLTFVNNNTVKIGSVTYERYAAFKARHPEIFKPLAQKGFDLERAPIIFDLD